MITVWVNQTPFSQISRIFCQKKTPFFSNRGHANFPFTGPYLREFRNADAYHLPHRVQVPGIGHMKFYPYLTTTQPPPVF